MATSKKPVSLTRKALLDELKTEVKSEVVDGKVVYCKAISEVKRTQRNAEAFDDKGELRPEYMQRRRIYTIIDHLCDADRNLLFSERDIPALSEADSIRLDRWYAVIVKLVGEENEGNE